MRYRVRVERAAEDELAAAIMWHDEQVPGLGDRLHDEAVRGMSKLAEFPGIGSLVAKVPRRFGLRRLLLTRFPYAIVFMVSDDVISVIAFAHTSRRPRYWMSRLR